MRTRSIVRPQEIDFEAPGHRDYFVALEHDTNWADHLIPLTVFVGPRAKPGQGLVAFGSNHGNEYEGPVAIHHLLRDIDISAVDGRIILVPVLNVAAFKAGTRESTLDDGVNLNRAFVKDAGRIPALGGITHRIADFVRTFIWPQVHVVLDLHAGGMPTRFALCTSFHPIEDAGQGKLIEETARWFGTPLILTYQNRTPGLLSSEAENLGKITIGCELGWGGSVNPEGVRYGRHGVISAAIRHGQLQGKLESIGHHRAGTQRKAALVESTCFTIAPFAGHYESLVNCGEIVSKGAAVGVLHDFNRLDLDPVPMRAGVDGIVVGQAWSAPVSQGSHVVATGILEA